MSVGECLSKLLYKLWVNSGESLQMIKHGIKPVDEGLYSILFQLMRPIKVKNKLQK